MTASERIGGRVSAAHDTQDDPAATPPVAGGAGPSPKARIGSWLLVLLGVVILPVTMVVTLTFTGTVHDAHAIDAAGARIVTADALEATYGIRVTLVAVTAEGGLVDVRFTVTDQTKAAAVLAEHAAMPALFVERSGAILSTSHPMAHKVVLIQGGTYFLLYPNSAGAVQPGTPVSIVVDGVRLAAITAQS
jgi:hypothetical protein